MLIVWKTTTSACTTTHTTTVSPTTGANFTIRVRMCVIKRARQDYEFAINNYKYLIRYAQCGSGCIEQSNSFAHFTYQRHLLFFLFPSPSACLPLVKCIVPCFKFPAGLPSERIKSTICEIFASPSPSDNGIYLNEMKI